ncbi:MAG: BTAD domain-containing putative transcriptional regulator [Candidatus Nanopelagicales bacterium]
MFQDLLRQARDAERAGSPSSAADLRRSALDLWRGPALVDSLAAPFAASAAESLELAPREALERRLTDDLAARRAGEILPEVTALAAAEPLRESTAALLMTGCTAPVVQPRPCRHTSRSAASGSRTRSGPVQPVAGVASATAPQRAGQPIQ